MLVNVRTFSPIKQNQEGDGAYHSNTVFIELYCAVYFVHPDCFSRYSIFQFENCCQFQDMTSFYHYSQPF